ncbi:acetylornithine transaminase [Methanolobus chelungpuianus]|uniref:Acetylornithine aminotransferase n=1 Tax=Methanolobus chelungpuianus TaxID=502115 RepID=A0AAE3HAV5_9EURY|nr:acetylornithine transaminase [Methanolobus chelungpuianus]MCQ6962733.1 acetylornithine aminotransferase [Methanolobus chelungpuianus]
MTDHLISRSSSHETVVRKDAKYVMQNYGRQPLVLESGSGCMVRDIDGNEYIDCVAGIAVNNVGHSHPKLVEAIKKQAEKLMHVSNIYYTVPQAELAEKLVQLTGMSRVFFCNSGTEAVEAAMKLARAKTGKTEFVAVEHAFHGRTMGALSLTYKEMYRAPFKPLVQEEKFVPSNDAQAVADAITGKTAAVIVEPIQGEGGINIHSDAYLKEVRKICDDTGTLLIFDEVQTGFGRTGKWFCKEHSGVEPDIMTMAKAMAGGFPMGAIAAREGISFERGQHAATFGGNPLACAAALASIDIIEKEGLLGHATEMGNYFMNRLKKIPLEGVVDVRGRGLMIGVELDRKCADIVDFAMKKGVLLNCTSEKVLRIAPPLVITKEQIDSVVAVLEQA